MVEGEGCRNPPEFSSVHLVCVGTPSSHCVVGRPKMSNQKTGDESMAYRNTSKRAMVNDLLPFGSPFLRRGLTTKHETLNMIVNCAFPFVLSPPTDRAKVGLGSYFVFRSHTSSLGERSSAQRVWFLWLSTDRVSTQVTTASPCSTFLHVAS